MPEKEERTDIIEYKVGDRVKSLIEKLEDMHVMLKTNKTYFEMVSDTVRFADMFVFLYKLLPDYARDDLDTSIGVAVPNYLSYRLTIVRGAGDNLVFQIKVGEREGISGLNELIHRCTKAFYALIDFLRKYGYEINVK